MFTGIIEELGEIRSIEHKKDLTVITIGAKMVLEGTKLGDSIAVNGTCLTATKLGSDYFEADVMPETLKKTELGTYHKGLKVNLERALAVGDRLGGHLVSGHIDGGAVLTKVTPLTEVHELTFKLDNPHEGLIIPKGSIAIDGISLTIMGVTKDTFTVGIIPHTFSVTNLGGKKIGDRVNIEFDMYGKYVRAQHEAKETLTRETLSNWGY